MIENENWIGEVLPRRRKKKIGMISVIAGTGMIPTFLLIFGIVILGSGVFASFSMVGGLLNALTGSSNLEALEEYSDILDGLTEEEILELVVSDKIDSSFYEMMMINREEFQYLLEQVIEYNATEVVKNIKIECEHVYTEWIEDENLPIGGYFVKRKEYPYQTITVNSRELENFYLDWQLVYALCLTDTMKGVDGWSRIPGNGEKGSMVHFGENFEEIDYIISNLRMNYEYITDLARSPKDTYSLEECKELVHTPYEYGDENTREGAWKYYYPHSVLSRAYSGYSCMYYLLGEDEKSLTNLICASDIAHFEKIMERFCPRYNFGYFSIILGFLPGGERIQDRLELYYGKKDTGYEIFDKEISYVIGSGIDKSLLPTSKERLDTDFGDLTDYGDLAFDETLGGKIVKEALEKVGCIYDQNRRWEEGIYDCSSFIWRILQSVGISLAEICSGSTAAEECRGMVNAGMVVSLSDMKQGDIIFYSGYVNGRYRNVTHVAIYAGDGKIVHAASQRDGVKVSNFYKSGLVCVCRPYKTS